MPQRAQCTAVAEESHRQKMEIYAKIKRQKEFHRWEPFFIATQAVSNFDKIEYLHKLN